MDVSLIMYTVLYLIICICIIYPPNEFLEAGFTINNLFSYWLGVEFENFISYQLKRISLTAMVYSLLPLGYIFFLILVHNDYNNEYTYFLWSNDNSLLWEIFATISRVLPLVGFFQIMAWTYDAWKCHPIIINLLKFSPNWKSLASDINTEYRSIHKIVIQCNAITKLVATENWIIKISPLSFELCHHSDTSLLVINSDEHEMPIHGTGQVQFLTIRVKTTRPNVADFTVRLNSNDFKDLEDRWGRAIPILPEVKFRKNITEKFVDAFKLVVNENVVYSTEQELDVCIGCMQSRANVKLQRNCSQTRSLEVVACGNCYCRPLWCCDCLGRWFASRQSPKEPNEWLASKCTCPMCRATFCVLDVSLIDCSENKDKRNQDDDKATLNDTDVHGEQIEQNQNHEE